MHLTTRMMQNSLKLETLKFYQLIFVMMCVIVLIMCVCECVRGLFCDDVIVYMSPVLRSLLFVGFNYHSFKKCFLFLYLFLFIYLSFFCLLMIYQYSVCWCFDWLLCFEMRTFVC